MPLLSRLVPQGARQAARRLERREIGNEYGRSSPGAGQGGQDHGRLLPRLHPGFRARHHAGADRAGYAPQVYQAIVTNEGSFRLGLVVALIIRVPLPHGRLGSLRPPATGQQEPGAALPAAQRRRRRHPGREHVVAGIRAAAGRRGQPHAGLLGGTAGGAGVPVHQRLQDGLGHGPAVLRHVAVPARLPGLQVRVPSPVPGRPSGARRDRRPDLVPPGPAAAGLPRDPLPRARRELRRRSSGWHCGSSSRA